MDETESKGEPTENEEDTSEDAEEESTASKMDEAGGTPDIEVEERSSRELVTPNLEAEAELDEEGWPDLPDEDGPASIDGLLGAAFATLFDDYLPDSESAETEADAGDGEDVLATVVSLEAAPGVDVLGDSNAELDEAAMAEGTGKKTQMKRQQSLADEFDYVNEYTL
jgi:hypothetical protein